MCDKGHDFSVHRRIITRVVVPSLSVAIALYDAALYVDGTEPWHGLLTIGHQAHQAIGAMIAALS